MTNMSSNKIEQPTLQKNDTAENSNSAHKIEQSTHYFPGGEAPCLAVGTSARPAGVGTPAGPWSGSNMMA